MFGKLKSIDVIMGITNINTVSNDTTNQTLPC